MLFQKQHLQAFTGVKNSKQAFPLLSKGTDPNQGRF
jgi:hypothetical protein